jgi:hypothetical protein
VKLPSNTKLADEYVPSSNNARFKVGNSQFKNRDLTLCYCKEHAEIHISLI